MLSLAAGLKWEHSSPLLASTLLDLHAIADRSLSEDRSVLVLAAIQERSIEIVSSFSAVERETLTTVLMDVFNTGHSVQLRCAVLNTLTALACEELSGLLGNATTPVVRLSSIASTHSSSPSSLNVSSSLSGGGLHGHHSTAESVPPPLTIPMWISELYQLLVATVASSSSHRHLKQSVLSADALNATALYLLDELHVVLPSLGLLCGTTARTRPRATAVASSNRGGADSRDPVPPTEALRSLQRTQRLFRTCELVHDSGAYAAAPPSGRLYQCDPGVKRVAHTAATTHSGTVRSPRIVHTPSSTSNAVAALSEAVVDVLENIDMVFRCQLPHVVRVLSTMWNYEALALPPSPQQGGPSTPVTPGSSSATRFDRCVLSTLLPNRNVGLQKQKRSRLESPLSTSGSDVRSSLFVDSLSLPLLLSTSWIFDARCRALAPPTFLPVADGGLPKDGIPSGYVLKTDTDGYGLYWDSPLERNVFADPRCCHTALRWWERRGDAISRCIVDNPALDVCERSLAMVWSMHVSSALHSEGSFPFLPRGQRMTNSNVVVFPSHSGWDTAHTMLMRLYSVSQQLAPSDAQAAVLYLRHLRDKLWYLPAVRTVVALAVASLVTKNPGSFVAPAAQLLATCRSAAVLHTLHAVEVYEGKKGNPQAFAFCGSQTTRLSTYAALLSAVVHHILLNEPSNRIVASFPVLTHAFGYRDERLPNKTELLDQLAVRIPEIPNTWYCGNHIVVCTRWFLVSEISRCLSEGSQTSAVRIVSTALLVLDIVLRHFSDLAVAQSAAMIRNALQHLPLDTVGFLLDVSADDVQEVLTFCERPQAPRSRDTAGAAHVTVQIDADGRDHRDISDSSASLSTVAVTLSLKWHEKIANDPQDAMLNNDEGVPVVVPPPPYLTGGTIELYDVDPEGLVEGWLGNSEHQGTLAPPQHSSLLPIVTLPIVTIGPSHSETHSSVSFEVASCGKKWLYPVYLSPSNGRVRLSTGLAGAAVSVPFTRFIRAMKFVSRLNAMPHESLVTVEFKHDSASEAEVVCRGLNALYPCSVIDPVCSAAILDVIPGITATVSWEVDLLNDATGSSILWRLGSSDIACLVQMEELLLCQYRD